jgi:hypothetical protein
LSAERSALIVIARIIENMKAGPARDRPLLFRGRLQVARPAGKISIKFYLEDAKI